MERLGPIVVSYDFSVPFSPRGGRLLPIVQAAIQFRTGEFQSALALVDTGAEMSLFDGATAIAAGVDPTRHFERVAPNVLGRLGFLSQVRVGLDGTALPPLLFVGLPEQTAQPRSE
jgi:hypothetical protein